jgi:hypothetical protein
MGNLRNISLRGTKDAQELVNTLGDYSGDFKLHYNPPHKNNIVVDAKSIMGVITIISPKFLTLEAPEDFDFTVLDKFLTTQEW